MYSTRVNPYSMHSALNNSIISCKEIMVVYLVFVGLKKRIWTVMEERMVRLKNHLLRRYAVYMYIT